MPCDDCGRTGVHKCPADKALDDEQPMAGMPNGSDAFFEDEPSTDEGRNS